VEPTGDLAVLLTRSMNDALRQVLAARRGETSHSLVGLHWPNG
jgi:hypothetical protein